MTRLDPSIIQSLSALVMQVGGEKELAKLSDPAILAALRHYDDLIAVRVEDFFVEVPDMDLAEGYQLFDKDYEQLYAIAASRLEGLEPAYGHMPEDQAWVYGSPTGTWGYLVYTSSRDQLPRVVFFIKVL